MRSTSGLLSSETLSIGGLIHLNKLDAMAVDESGFYESDEDVCSEPYDKDITYNGITKNVLLGWFRRLQKEFGQPLSFV